MESASDSDLECTPPEVHQTASDAIHKLLPEKSKTQYQITYRNFKDWCSTKKVTKTSENVLLAYLEEKSQSVKPSTLWSIYSMLKSTLNINENINISQYAKLVPFLKRKSVGHRPKKSKVLTQDDVQRFLKEADDEQYLLIKVAVIFGISGAMRREELTKLTVDNIEDRSSILVINIPDSKTHSERTFTITHLEYLGIYRKYAALRPRNASSNRFFCKYVKGKCVNQVVGINKFGEMPSIVAKYLNLPDAKRYTGHCFRRTSATLLSDSGASITDIKRHGGWKSTTVAESYIEDSITQKNKISDKILDVNVTNNRCYNISSVSVERPLSNQNVYSGTSSTTERNSGVSGVNITNCTGLTINIYNNVPQ